MSNPTASSTVGLVTAPRVISIDLFNSMRTRRQNLSVEQGSARGSFLVAGEQFDRWLASAYSRRWSASIPQSRR
jgi:hypothetical protein